MPHIQDIAQGVEITRKIGQGTVVNELDIVIMANKRYTVYQKLNENLISDLLRFIKPPGQPGGFFYLSTR